MDSADEALNCWVGNYGRKAFTLSQKFNGFNKSYRECCFRFECQGAEPNGARRQKMVLVVSDYHTLTSFISVYPRDSSPPMQTRKSGPLSACQRNAIEWRFAGGPMVA